MIGQLIINSTIFYLQYLIIFGGGCQHLEQPNVERPIFRNFQISNIKITKDELFDFFVFIFYF